MKSSNKSEGYSVTFNRGGERQTVQLETLNQVVNKIRDLKRNRRKLVSVVRN